MYVVKRDIIVGPVHIGVIENAIKNVMTVICRETLLNSQIYIDQYITDIATVIHGLMPPTLVFLVRPPTLVFLVRPPTLVFRFGNTGVVCFVQ